MTVAEKVDTADRHLKQIELCDRHARVVVEQERLEDWRSSTGAIGFSASGALFASTPAALLCQLIEERTLLDRRGIFHQPDHLEGTRSCVRPEQ
jgi:hypothetical protein